MMMTTTPSFGAPDLSGALEEACVALGYGDPSRRAELMDALTNGVPDDVVAQVVATRGGDRGHVAQELARRAGPFREALKRVAILYKARPQGRQGRLGGGRRRPDGRGHRPAPARDGALPDGLRLAPRGLKAGVVVAGQTRASMMMIRSSRAPGRRRRRRPCPRR